MKAVTLLKTNVPKYHKEREDETNTELVILSATSQSLNVLSRLSSAAQAAERLSDTVNCSSVQKDIAGDFYCRV